jgi:glycosyltransferase involved in cell wall biosynthesis
VKGLPSLLSKGGIRVRDYLSHLGWLRGRSACALVPHIDPVVDHPSATSPDGGMVSRRHVSAMPASAPRRRVLMLLENSQYIFDLRVKNEARTLVRAGYQVAVICPKWRGGKTFEVGEDKVRVYQFPAPKPGTSIATYAREYVYATLVISIFSLVVWIREGFDILHLHNPPDTLCLIGALYKLLGKRVVFDHHDLSPELYEVRFGGSLGPIVHGALLALERLSCRLADSVIATNESYKALEIARDRVPEERITIVRNGPDINRVFSSETDVKLRQKAGTILGYVGVIGPQDGVDYMLRAIHHLVYGRRRDVFCVIMGDGDMVADLVVLADRLRLRERISFAGWLPSDSEQFGRYLSTIDICLDPDPYNPYNARCTMIKMMEYMAFGKPIVAFDLPEHRITAGDAALYARANDERDFADKIAVLIEDPQRRKRMGAIGRARIETSFAWSHQEAGLLAAYTKLWSGRGQSRRFH